MMTTRSKLGCVDLNGNCYVIQQEGPRAAAQLRKIDDEFNVMWATDLNLRGGTTSVSIVQAIAVNERGQILLGIGGAGLTTAAVANTAVLQLLDDEGNVQVQVDVGAEWPNNNMGYADTDNRGHWFVFPDGTTTADFAHMYDDELNVMLDAGTSYA